MGTPLREAIEEIGGGARPGHEIKAVLAGVANGVITADKLDTPLTYEDMQAAGSGLGSGGFIVFDDSVDMVSVAAGVARFLSIESCGQCLPCKLDGMVLANLLTKLGESEAAKGYDDALLRKRIRTVGDRARCFLATQQQTVLQSLLDNFGDEFAAHFAGTRGEVEPELIAELIDIRGGRAQLDERHRLKQADWSYDKEYSGTVPVDLYTGKVPPWRH